MVEKKDDLDRNGSATHLVFLRICVAFRLLYRVAVCNLPLMIRPTEITCSKILEHDP